MNLIRNLKYQQNLISTAHNASESRCLFKQELLGRNDDAWFHFPIYEKRVTLEMRAH